VTLHLVRYVAPPDGAVAPGDVVVHEVDGRWTVTDAELVDLLFRAARVAVW
jgi:hypothetical protein